MPFDVDIANNKRNIRKVNDPERQLKLGLSTMSQHVGPYIKTYCSCYLSILGHYK